ncbi:MAG: glycosyltransferase family 25 protein [Planctomycetota bacterium]|jgi:hypothetical protein
MDVSSRQPEPAVPLLWINLERAAHRRRRMEWALAQGGWAHERLEAVDGRNRQLRFRAVPDLAVRGAALPGVRRMNEARPWRRTTRSELACLASWQRAVARAGARMESDDVPAVLVLEDDVGACLAVPHAWPVSLADLVDGADRRSRDDGHPWTAIQLAPINPRERKRLHAEWKASGGTQLVVPKTTVRSHGNGAVLLHRRALPHLDRHVRRLAPESTRYVLRHPWAVRPVADKWLYAMLPPSSVYVATYPLFCLDACDSELHPDHVDRYHRPSRDVTVELWEQDGLDELVLAQRSWDELT